MRINHDPNDPPDRPPHQPPPQPPPPPGIEPPAPGAEPGPGPFPPPTPGPDPNQDTTGLPPDQIGDIPPPPVPPPPIVGPGVGGVPGTEGGTLSQPGTRGAMPFHTAAYSSPASPRFGPGVPMPGGSTGVSGLGDNGPNPDAIGELLRQLAASRGSGQ